MIKTSKERLKKSIRRIASAHPLTMRGRFPEGWHVVADMYPVDSLETTEAIARTRRTDGAAVDRANLIDDWKRVGTDIYRASRKFAKENHMPNYERHSGRK